MGTLNITYCLRYQSSTLIWLHTVLLAHLKNTSILHEFINESTIILKIVNMSIFKLVKEGKLFVLIKIGIRICILEERMAHFSIIAF